MALLDVDWEACVLEPRPDAELESYVRRALGVVPSAVPYFTVAPWLVRGMASLLGSPRVHVDAVLSDLIGLVVSQDNSCRYCFAVQEMMMRVHGFSPAQLRALEQDFLEAEIDPRQKVALDFARRISRAAPLVSPADARPLLAAGWSPAEVREIVFVTVQNVFMNRLVATPAIPPQREERVAESWWLSWVAPFMRMGMKKRWRCVRPMPLAPEQKRGPWSPSVNALDGLPGALVLRRTLDDAWSSPALPQRSKALIFAVIARALGCSLGEREARALGESSGLAPDALDAIVTHLGSPALDAADAALVPFARVTSRARPSQLQQRARALREHLSPEPFVEAVGLCALANMMCRLSVVTGVA